MKATIKSERLRTLWWSTKILLRALALWPILKDNSTTTKVVNFFHYCLVALGTIFQIVSMSAMCWMNFTDFTSAAESIGPMMALYISLGKICLYRHQSDRLSRLAGSIEVCINNEESDELKYLKEYLKFGGIACVSLHSVAIFLTVGYLSYPLFLSDRILPFNCYYPWNWEESSILYAIVYSHEAAITILLSGASATEYTYIWSVFHCCARLKVIQERLNQLRNVESEETVDQLVSSFVELHASVFRDVELINGAYTNIVMLLFLAAVVAICSAGLQITSTVASMSYVILFIFLAIYFAEQLFFYYLPGEILAEQVSAVGFEAYTCGWENLQLKHRRTMLFLIMKSNAPVRLLAGNMTPLRLENYASFLATTFSYFTSISAVA